MSKAVKKKKVRRNVTMGIAYIKATFNNTVVTITDTKGDTLCWASAGTCGSEADRVGVVTPQTPAGRARADTRDCRDARDEDYEGVVGSVSSTVVPLSRSLATEIVPPLNSTLRLAIGRPRPVPVAFVEKYGSKARASASASIPTPVSETRMRTA